MLFLYVSAGIRTVSSMHLNNDNKHVKEKRRSSVKILYRREDQEYFRAKSTYEILMQSETFLHFSSKIQKALSLNFRKLENETIFSNERFTLSGTQ